MEGQRARAGRAGQEEGSGDDTITMLVSNNCPHQSGPLGIACISLNDTSRAHNISGNS